MRHVSGCLFILALSSVLCAGEPRPKSIRCNKLCPANHDPVCGSDGKTYSNLCGLNVASCENKRKGLHPIRVVGKGPCKPTCCPKCCPIVYRPLCGTDGKTYANVCCLNMASHENKKKGLKPIRVAFKGHCKPICIPGCPTFYQPVCGTDGRTYRNVCQLNAASCRRQNRGGKPIFVAHKGKCKPRCKKFCNDNYEPVCGTDGKTYQNVCHLKAASCESQNGGGKPILIAYNGKCRPCRIFCAKIYKPVCGTDGKTYSNKCALKVASCKSQSTGGKPIRIDYEGKCRPCRILCPKIYKPVCGTDGKTYANKCALKVASCKSQSTGGKPIRIAYKGKCRPCRICCPKIYKPVCGTDGKTYANKCALKVASCKSQRTGGKPIDIAYKGKCRPCRIYCQTKYNPVCGTDGKTYANKCALKVASCKSQRTGGKPIDIAYKGKCKRPCQKLCPAVHQPVCGTDGKTYGNLCRLEVASCERNREGKEEIDLAHRGKCKPKCSNICPEIFQPVCGTDGKTYANACLLKAASCKNLRDKGESISIAHEGPCRNCAAITCPAIDEPVCGSDGNTYPNECQLKAASCLSVQNGKGQITVKHAGKCGKGCPNRPRPQCIRREPNLCTSNAFCREAYRDKDLLCCHDLCNNKCYNTTTQLFITDPPRPCPRIFCPQTFHPICGSNGVTYINRSDLRVAMANNPRLTVKHVGKCKKYGPKPSTKGR